ncbi:hypothetical protein BO86DRAFT_428564 [Aspergillus japonicus CBS 114.51]|uniref:Nephrocystin 3-like N-terminal domain-containing protein n=1 Tax=Aspergillus japonicus CBS 114.51 TaxID=1448312 RepID=A0A8T8XES0_ASPJA|nr:hypothetical protein BO86DRAFT_428564 [Aspergillus japonicus CBS 114.51]RAH86793.1 hypothetical protein BO86DRAFT_428564 [Aspergillus japonicus CBS 114.51]
MRRLRQKVSHGWDCIWHRETNADRGSTSSNRTRHDPDQPTEQQLKESATSSVLCRDSTPKEKYHCEDPEPRDISQGNSATLPKHTQHHDTQHSLAYVVKDEDAGEKSKPDEPSQEDHHNKGQARDLWNEAFEKLSPATRAQLRAFGYEPVSRTSQQEQSLNTIIKVLQQKQKQCDEETWTFDVGQHKIIVRDYASKCATWVQLIGDLVVPFAPSQAAGPWGLIKKVLEVPVAFDKQMTALLGTVDRVLQVTHRARVYEVIYSAEDGGIEETLHRDLVNVYQATLELLSYSTDLLSTSTTERVLKGMFDQTTGLFSDLAAKERELNYTASACESKRSAESDVKILQHMQALQGYLPRIDSRVTAFLERLEVKDALEILDWVSSVKYGENHNLVRGNRTQGTGDWLLQHRIFRQWEDSSSTAVLWLRGSRSRTDSSQAGTGKTFLTSRVIDHVEGTLRTTANDEGFAYFYCNRTEDIRTRPLAVAQSYVRQLSSCAIKISSCYIQSKLRICYKEQRIRAASLDLALCKTLLIESLNLYPRTTLILDAFDECDPASRKELLRLFEELLRVSRRPVRLFIASRPDGDIRSRFQSHPNIEIQATDNRDDIQMYIRQRIPDVIAHEELHAPVMSALLEKCDGMFQWTALQLDQLAKCVSAETILECLGILPRTLDETYDRLYQEMYDRGSHDRKLAQRAFQWVLAVNTPLSRQQLLEVIRVNPEHDGVELCAPITSDELLSLCRNLLVIDSEQDLWRVSHLSVAEYFEQRHGWHNVAVNLMASKVCLQVMLSEIYWGRLMGSSLPSELGAEVDYSPVLMRYSAFNWHKHLQRLENSPVAMDDDLAPVTGLLEKFLGAPEASSAQYRLWAPLEDMEPADCSILAVCRYGFVQILVDWWRRAELSPVWSDDIGPSPTMVAVRNGHAPIVQALLQKGVSIAAQANSMTGLTPLKAAVSQGQVEVVRILLEEVNRDFSSQEATDDCSPSILESCSRFTSSALEAAILNTDLTMLRLLVCVGFADANLRLPLSDYGSVLVLAAGLGWLEGSQCLVEEGGADVDLLLHHGAYGSALAAAAWCSRRSAKALELMKYFVESRQANVNLPLHTGLHGSALAAAVDAGAPRAIRYLLDVEDFSMLKNKSDGC